MRSVDFDRRHQVSPYTVYRRLTTGEPFMLVDLAEPHAPRPALLHPALVRPSEDWRPPADIDVVLFDQDGCHALECARDLVAGGYERVRSLFGGLELWDLALGHLDREATSPCEDSCQVAQSMV